MPQIRANLIRSNKANSRISAEDHIEALLEDVLNIDIDQPPKPRAPVSQTDAGWVCDMTPQLGVQLLKQATI